MATSCQHKTICLDPRGVKAIQSNGYRKVIDMNKIVGIVGSGIIGRDPFDPYCWSGSSCNLFTALQQLNVLEGAFGVEANNIQRYGLALKNFSFNKRRWRNKLNLDPYYYNALTTAVRCKISRFTPNNRFLQIGAIYDVPDTLPPHTKCYSYHDGNIAEMMRSPMFPKSLLPNAQRAFDWESRIYQKLTKIFTMSEYLRNSFINDFNISEDKVVNVGVGANFEIPKTLPQKDYSKQEILFIGADFERKGGNTLVKAFNIARERNPNAILHIVGPRIKPQILEEHHKNIVYHGFLSRAVEEENQKFFSLMQNCTLQVLPSLYEPFGIVILEAMVYGMPSIATNKWAFPEMICPNTNGALVQPNDVKELADAMDRYLSNTNMREIHGKTARDVTIQKYSWSSVAQKIAEQTA